jgi:hypothetical protein
MTTNMVGMMGMMGMMRMTTIERGRIMI